jgi:hypothetical protein
MNFSLTGSSQDSASDDDESIQQAEDVLLSFMISATHHHGRYNLRVISSPYQRTPMSWEMSVILNWLVIQNAKHSQI